MIRLLIIDDSATARELLEAIFAADREIRVVGLAKNGKEGVQLAKELKPDVITMDIEMPVMNGFQATKKIMTECPTPTVIVSASTAIHEQETAMKAMQAGALTLLLKPFGPKAPEHPRQARELVATVKAMADVKVVRHYHRESIPSRIKVSEPPSILRGGSDSVVAIASSTGGPPALVRVLSRLPANFPAPILIVQHIAQGFTEGLVSYLNSVVPLHVKLANACESLKPATIYIAPEDRHLGVAMDGTISISSQLPIDGFRPSATFLFESVASVIGPKAVGVIMTGMGSDGVAGLAKLRAAGGRVIAQDEETCVVFGMPAAAIEAGVVDRVIPLDSIALEISSSIGARQVK
jgi:two-component system chemotaxis response regulator CheB